MRNESPKPLGRYGGEAGGGVEMGTDTTHLKMLCSQYERFFATGFSTAAVILKKTGNNGQTQATMDKTTVKKQITPLLSFYYSSLLALYFVQVCKGDGERAKFKGEISSNLVTCQGGKAGQKDCVCSWGLHLW